MANNVELLNLYSCLRRAISLRATSVLKESGLGTRQFVILRALSQNERLSMSELVERSLTDAATTSRCVSQLVRDKWVQRIQCSEDGRVWFVKLTSKGMSLVPEIERLFAQLSDQCFGTLDPEEKENLAQTLTKVVEKLGLCNRGSDGNN